jgi:hypothetical protein
LLIDNTTGGIASVLTLNGGGATALHIQENGIVENSSSYAGSSQVIRLVNATDVFKMSGNGTYIHNNNANIPRRSSGSTSSNYDFATTSLFELKNAAFDANPVYGCLGYNISGTNSAARNLSISGDLLVLQGTLGVAASTNNTFTIGGNVIISPGAVFRGSSSTGTSTINVSGSVTGSGTLQGSSNSGGTTNITVGGDITSFINFATGANTLTFSGGNSSSNFNPANVTTPTVQQITAGDGITAKTITLGTSISIAASKTITINNASTFICGTKKINGSGSVTIMNGGILKLGSTNVTGVVEDNISATGGLILNSGSTVELNGVASQVLNARSFSNLVINNTSGVSLLADVTVTGTLSLSNGTLAIGNNVLTLSGPAISGLPANLVTTPGSSLAFEGNANGVFIPSSVIALNNLVVNNSNGVSVNSSLVVSGTLTLTSGILNIGSTTLTLNGPVIATGGALNGTSNCNLVVGGTSVQSISFAANASLNNLSLNKTAGTTTLATSLNIYGTIEWLNTNSTLDLNSQNLVLKSTLAGTARIAEVPASKLLNATNVTVERYIPARRAWRLLTAPLTGTANNSLFYNWQNNGVQNGGGFEIWAPSGSGIGGNGLATGAGSSLRKYTAAGWANIANTKSELLFDASLNYPFAVFVTGAYGSGNIASGSAATTAKATGSLRTGDITYSNLPSGKHSLLGNPYASPIDINAVMTASTGLDPYVWLWDPSIGSVGGYVTYDVVADSYTTAVSYPADVQCGQAFFVKANNSINTLTFQENLKTAGVTNTVFRGNALASIFRTTLLKDAVPIAAIADGVMNVYLPGENAVVDHADAIKLANSGENIAITRNGMNLSVEHRPLFTGSDTIFFMVSNTAAAGYTLKFNCINMPAGATAYLHDRYLNTMVPIDLTGTSTDIHFSVTAEPLSTGNRFCVIFQTLKVLPVAYIYLTALEKDNDVILNWTNADETNIDHYEIERSLDGSRFTSIGTKAVSAGNYEWLDRNLFGNEVFYRVQAVGVRGDRVHSPVCRVIKRNKTPIVTISVDPSVHDIHIQLKNIPGGSYQFTLFNSAGQAVITKSVKHPAGASAERLRWNQFQLPGIYFLKITGPGLRYYHEVLVNP